MYIHVKTSELKYNWMNNSGKRDEGDAFIFFWVLGVTIASPLNLLA